MAGGLLLTPSYTEDIVYPAYQDRLLLKSLGVQAGIVEAEDFKVTAGSGLQVNVNKGKAFIEQTKAIEESNNIFYNGLYNVQNPVEQNPYNSVEIPTSNPQIAQIILRVYDISELKISGSSYARIEWLNGTPNAGATKSHVEEGKASEFGAAALPQSSYRIAYVVVPKNATVSSEYSIVGSRNFSSQWPLVIKTHESNFTAVSGEMCLVQGEYTVSLPNIKNGYCVGIYNNFIGATVTIKPSTENFIYGDFISASSQIKLLTQQHVILQGYGNNWYITSGEAKREQVYNAPVERSSGIEYEPSSAREVFVSIFNKTASGLINEIYIGGVLMNNTTAIGGTTWGTFICPAGVKWKAITNESKTFYTSYLVR